MKAKNTEIVYEAPWVTLVALRTPKVICESINAVGTLDTWDEEVID